MNVRSTSPSRSTVAATLAAAAVIALASTACDDKKTSVAPAASALAPSSASASPTSANVTKFTIDPASTTTLSLEAPKEKIKASTTAAAGTLDVDPTNLVNSRGEVKIDLTTLTTKTFDDAKQNESQTMHARTWLEVADGEQGKLEDSVKSTNRWAIYAIRSIENVAPNADLRKVTPTKDGGDDVRTVTMTTKGELLVHGHKVDRDADVEVEVRYPAGSDKPKAIAIKTKKPFRVELAAHDVKPRDGFGKIAKSSFHLLGTKVADSADIALDLRAKPQS